MLTRSRIIDRVWAPALLVLAVYGIWLCVAFQSGRDPRTFVRMGLRYLEKSHASAVIKVDRRFQYYPPNVGGYDGQYYYYIALDPAKARYYMDQPTYRYTRILYPITARLLALGQPELVPYSLILINWLAIAGGTLAVAAWLRRRRVSPWFALVYGLFPGLFISLQRDLAEPLAFGLTAFGVYLLACKGNHRVIWAGLTFGLAALTRETTVIFPAIYGLGMLLHRSGPSEGALLSDSERNRRDAKTLLAMALAPIAIYKLFLVIWLAGGTAGMAAAMLPALVPFAGFTSWPLNASRINELISVIIPGIVCALAALWKFRSRGNRVELWLLLANVQLFVVMLNHLSYVGFGGSGRVTTGVVLSALYCLPLFDHRHFMGIWWLWACCFCWMFLWPSIAVFSDNPLGIPNVTVGLALIVLLSRMTASPQPTVSTSLPDRVPLGLRTLDRIRSSITTPQSIP